MQLISSQSGRRIVLGLILAGFIASLLTLWFVSRGGAVTFETAKDVIARLLQHYVPLLSILVGFYFSERALAEDGARISKDTLILAIVLIGGWTLLPPVLLVACDTVNAAMRLMETVSTIGHSLTAACLAYFFSKSGQSSRLT
jgi:hypothetical protein